MNRALIHHGPSDRYKISRDLSPDDRTMTLSPFDIRAITPVEYFPEIARQCPDARSVVTCETAMVMGDRLIPIMTAPMEMNEIWNRCLRQYADIVPKLRTRPDVD